MLFRSEVKFAFGAGFSFSSGAEYGPAYLLEEDMVFATFNYRLALFGKQCEWYSLGKSVVKTFSLS